MRGELIGLKADREMFLQLGGTELTIGTQFHFIKIFIYIGWLWAG